MQKIVYGFPNDCWRSKKQGEGSTSHKSWFKMPKVFIQWKWTLFIYLNTKLFCLVKFPILIEWFWMWPVWRDYWFNNLQSHLWSKLRLLSLQFRKNYYVPTSLSHLYCHSFIPNWAMRKYHFFFFFFQRQPSQVHVDCGFLGRWDVRIWLWRFQPILKKVKKGRLIRKYFLFFSCRSQDNCLKKE